MPLRLGASNTKDDASDNVEYSSREVKPSLLLLQDLLRAHSVFLLHHAASLSALFVRTKRHKFVNLLSRYWDLFLSTWNVLLHGNPATNIFGGIKIAACGELGIGVGEEDRGSGEREVLEGFVDRTEGLVDMVVSKFGLSDMGTAADSLATQKPAEGEVAVKWLGSGDEPGAEDGAIFLGVGALSRKSLRDVTFWMEDLYSWGEDAYGVKDNPSSTRQTRKSKKPRDGDAKVTVPNSRNNTEEPAGASPKQLDTTALPAQALEPGTSSPTPAGDATDEGGVTKFMQYFKLGYGTHWSLGGSGDTESPKLDSTAANNAPHGSEAPDTTSTRQPVILDDRAGRFLIGLMGGLEESGPNSPAAGSPDGSGSGNEGEYNSRILLRTLTVELDGIDRPENELTVDLGSQEGKELTTTTTTTTTTGGAGQKDSTDRGSHFDSQDRNKTQRLRVVVYVHKPFIYTFLFRSSGTDCLAWNAFYRSLHHQLAPLGKPLGRSTAYRPDRPDVAAASNKNNNNNILDIVWDPKSLTIHSTLPSIPDPLQHYHHYDDATAVSGRPTPPRLWSRAEALSTHNQVLNTYIATRSGDNLDLERTCKTNRGWWIVWTRILERQDDPTTAATEANATASGSTTPRAPSSPSLPPDDGHRAEKRSTAAETEPEEEESGDHHPHHQHHRPRPPPRRNPRVDKEIFLVRRAGGGEHATSGFRAFSTSYVAESSLAAARAGGNGGAGVGGWADGAGRLVQGIGVDTRKYIEGLLSLAR